MMIAKHQSDLKKLSVFIKYKFSPIGICHKAIILISKMNYRMSLKDFFRLYERKKRAKRQSLSLMGLCADRQLCRQRGNELIQHENETK